MSKREHNIQSGGESKTPLFYAPLTGSINATIAHDADTSVYKSTIGSINNDGLTISTARHGVVWNSSVPVNTNLTFSCWVKRTGGSGVNYSFGAATKNNAKYYGIQLAQYNSYWLIQEYLYFCYVGSSYMPDINTWTFISWTIIYNGSNNYTCKFYKNGIIIDTKTFTNNQWLGMTDCYFAISHFTNSMYAQYKHFSCYNELTDNEVLQLYQNGGEGL